MSYTHNPNLYQWKRFTKKPSTQKHSGGGDSKYDEDWIKKKLDKASQQAIAVAFHEKNLDRKFDEYDLESNDEFHEANQLLNDWMSSKLHDEYLNEAVVVPVKEKSTPGKWYNDTDAFMEHCLQTADLGLTSGGVDKDTYGIDFDKICAIDDDDKAASAITQQLLEKPIDIDTRKIRSSSRRKPAKVKSDPARVMELRHQAVKEKLEKRRNAERVKLQEKLQKQETQIRAKEVLKKEEQNRRLKIKQEEDAIKKEMVRLRKEFAVRKQQKIQKFESDKTQNNASPSSTSLKQPDEVQSFVTESTVRNATSEIEKEKLKINLNIFKLKLQKRTLRRCFATWYKTVLQRKMKMGKAKAMSEWRIVMKAWIAWKKYLQNIRDEKDVERHAAAVRQMQMTEKIAQESNKQRMLRKYFLYWKLWVKNMQEKHEIEKQKRVTKLKMEALIEKVVSLKTKQDLVLESLDAEDDISAEETRFKSVQNKKQVDRIFAEKSKPGRLKSNPNSSRKPKNAWQVKKDHVYKLTPAEMENISGDSTNQVGRNSQRQRSGKLRDPYQNRHKFQKEMMEEQKHLIQEQKRMIEDLKEERKLLALNTEIKNFKVEGEMTNRREEHPDKSSSFVTGNIEKTRTTIQQKTAHPLVTAMEKRAQERAKRHEEMMERKRQKEQEKLAEIQARELERLKQEEEKQRMLKEEKIKEKKEKLRLEVEKKAFQERLKLLRKTAVNHYNKSLLKRCGLTPLKRLVASSRAKHEVAVCHHNEKLVCASLHAWNSVTKSSEEKRNELARKGYEQMLHRRALRHWMLYGKHMDILEQKAEIHYNKILKQKYIQTWKQFTINEKLRQWDHEAKAEEHNIKRMKKRVFVIISTFRRNAKSLREHEERISELRNRVTRMLPDFQPNLSNSFQNEDV